MTSIVSQPTLFQVPKAHSGNIKKCFIAAPRYPDSTGVIRRGVINHYKMRFRFMSAKWNAATRYSAHPFTTKTGARVHFFCLNYPRIRGWYQARELFTLLVVEMVRGIYELLILWKKIARTFCFGG